MSKTIELKPTKNGTDYIMVNMVLNGTRVSSFGQSIKSLKPTIEGGFLGKEGKQALDAYIAEHGKDKIMADMAARQAAKGNSFSL